MSFSLQKNTTSIFMWNYISRVASSSWKKKERIGDEWCRRTELVGHGVGPGVNCIAFKISPRGKEPFYHASVPDSKRGPLSIWTNLPGTHLLMISFPFFFKFFYNFCPLSLFSAIQTHFFFTVSFVPCLSSFP